MQNRYYCDPTITNCTFYGNTASHSGAVSNHSNSNPTLVGCLFSGNLATDDGGAIRNTSNSNPELINCTFTANEATSGKGGGIFNDFSSPTLTNCILWGNFASDGNEIALLNSSTIDVNYCDIKDGNDGIYNDACSPSTINWGTGNIDANPLFLADIPDQVRLLATSPCIDTGDNNSVPVDVTTDIEGHPRITDGDCNDTGIVDMGAYEFDWAYLGDFAGGCDVDFVDFSVLGLTWLLEQGQPGYNPVCDIALPADSFIDEKDLKIFTDGWLVGVLN
jgi:predicted outer membrane repeat protein